MKTFNFKRCECSDPGCPHCHGRCSDKAVETLYRVDMEDRTGTDFCEGCARSKQLKERNDMQTKHTPGPWIYDEIWSLIKGPKGEEICALHTGVTNTAQDAKRFNRAIAQANARLIAEAGTVASETGLTPRQLAEQRQELLGAVSTIIFRLKFAVAVMERDLTALQEIDAKRDCGNAYLTSLHGNSIVIAKAAIAKAEGAK